MTGLSSPPMTGGERPCIEQTATKAVIEHAAPDVRYAVAEHNRHPVKRGLNARPESFHFSKLLLDPLDKELDSGRQKTCMRVNHMDRSLRQFE